MNERELERLSNAVITDVIQFASDWTAPIGWRARAERIVRERLRSALMAEIERVQQEESRSER